jgi:hypothetical protein
MMTVQCAWCKRFRLGVWSDGFGVASEWTAANPDPLDEITHGICPECLEKEIKRMNEEEK